jgi:hypothetical protein
MRNIIAFLVFFVTIFVYSSAHAEFISFTLIDASYSISGSLNTFDVNSNPPGQFIYDSRYDDNSSDPISNELHNDQYFVYSSASYNEVEAVDVGPFSVNPNRNGGIGGRGRAQASSVIDLKPAFRVCNKII